MNKTTETTASPKPQMAAAELKRLEETALVVFAHLVQRYGNPDGDALSKRAFKLAAHFLQAAAQVAAGEFDPAPEPAEMPIEIRVPLWELVEDKGARQEWRPMLDPTTEEPLEETVFCDRDAFSPNLPPDHPLNRRFKSRDGRTVEELQAENAAEKTRREEAKARARKQSGFLQRIGLTRGDA